MHAMRIQVSAIVAAAALVCFARAEDSTGLLPITDMQSSDTYAGYAAGLYPNMLNYPVGAALADRLHAAMQIRPRDALGAPSPTGRIVLLSVGMSNTSQESTAFSQQLAQFSDRHPALTFINGAQGGQTAQIISNPNAQFWQVIDQRLANAGVTAQQVQAVWFKEANGSPTGPAADYISTLREDFETIMQILRTRFPNLKSVWASSRIYGGYATTMLNPEPYAYASGFAVQDLIADQIAGDPGLTPGDGGVAPFVQWGAYLWADGLAGRDDGLIWEQGDFQSDGTHPSPSGAAKVAALLLEDFANGWTSRLWFVRPQLQRLVGDMNGDRNLTVADIGAFVLALTDPAGYAAQFPNINANDVGDLNEDDVLSVGDVGPFVQLLTAW